MKRKPTLIASILAAGTLAGYAQSSDVASPTQGTRDVDTASEQLADVADSGDINVAKEPQMLFDMRRLQGHEVQNPQGENIADIEKLLIDQSGQIHYAVLGTGGFLDLGERLVAVPFDALSITEEPVMNDLEGVEDDTVADADNTNADRSEADDANMAKKLATNDRADADNDRVADAETDADADVDTNTEVVDPSETQVNREQETRFVIQINATRDQLVNAPEFKEEDVKMLLSDSSSNKVTEFWNNPTAEPETQGAE